MVSRAVFGGSPQSSCHTARRSAPRADSENTGQIAKRSAARFNRFACAGSFVRRKVVDHDDILALEGRGQTLFDVGQKLGSIH
jgi:hypothetical protein